MAHSKSRKMNRRARKGRRTSRRGQRGGGLGQSYSFGAPIVPGLGNSAEVMPYSSCTAIERPGAIAAPTTGLGLPGLSGGARRRRRRGSRRSRSQRGGRYTFDLAAPTTGGTPWGAGIPQVARIPCESSSTTANPLNQAGGVGGVDSAFYLAPTAGYSNTASTWVGSTGAPSLLQTPYAAQTMNPACLKTGGGRRSRRSRRSSHKGRRRH